MGREYPPVQHVGIGEDVVGVLAYPFAFFDRGVSVVHSGPDPVAQGSREVPHRAPLVGCQGLGGGEVEGGRPTAVGGLGAVQEGTEDRGEVGQGLAGRRTGGDHDRLAVQCVLGRGGLMGPWMIDAGLLDGGDDFRTDAIGPDGMGSRARGQVLRMSDARGPARPCGEPVEDHVGRGAGSPALGRSTGAVILGHRHRVCHWRDGQWSQGVVHGCP